MWPNELASSVSSGWAGPEMETGLPKSPAACPLNRGPASCVQRALALDYWLTNEKIKALASRIGSFPSIPSIYFEVLKLQVVHRVGSFKRCNRTFFVIKPDI